MRTIDGAKVAGKRRKGVAFFVRHFPVSCYNLGLSHEADEADIR
jgi:hypothetical protein